MFIGEFPFDFLFRSFESSFGVVSVTGKKSISNRRNTFARERELRFIRLRMGFGFEFGARGFALDVGDAGALKGPCRRSYAMSSCGETRAVRDA